MTVSTTVSLSVQVESREFAERMVSRINDALEEARAVNTRLMTLLILKGFGEQLTADEEAFLAANLCEKEASGG